MPVLSARPPDPGAEPIDQTAFIVALGSNLGDRLGALVRGLTFLQDHVRLDAVSRVVESDAWGPVEQPAFLNVVARGRTDLGARALLDRCRAAEMDAGRRDRIRWGPRELDVDVIFYGQERVDTPELTVPHPRWAERPFVAGLVGEVAGTMVDPESGRPLIDLVGDEPLPSTLREYARVEYVLRDRRSSEEP